jgi:hypothetical protein
MFMLLFLLTSFITVNWSNTVPFRRSNFASSLLSSTSKYKTPASFTANGIGPAPNSPATVPPLAPVEPATT